MAPDTDTHALIVVDVQNDFCPGGSLAVPGGDKVVPVINHLADTGLYSTVVATRDWHENPGKHFSANPDYINSWPRHCVINTNGAEYHPELKKGAISCEFLKGRFEASYSGFDGRSTAGEKLIDFLRQASISHVTVVGLATDYCVKATALDAVMHGLKVSVILKACRGVSEKTTELAIDEMRNAGIEIIE